MKSLLFSPINSVPNALNSSYLPGLDGLRAISIIIVIISHFLFPTPSGVYFNGAIGVNIFFVISGFLITTLLLKEKVKYGKVSFKKFFIRRALRIVPVAYLYLLVLMLLNNPLKLSITTESFITAFLYLKNFPIAGEWYTGHYWTLSVEEQFYIIFPFFIIFKVNKFAILSMVLVVVIPIVSFFAFNNIGVFQSNLIVHKVTYLIIHIFGRGTECIIVGALYAVLVFKRVLVIEKLKGNRYTSLLLFILGLFILSKPSFLYVQHLSEIVFPLIVGYVILLNLRDKNLFRYILDNQIMIKIGLLSYSLYIWQQLFTGSQAFNLFPFSDTFPVKFLLLLIISFLSYNYYEKFFLKFKSKFKKG